VPVEQQLETEQPEMQDQNLPTVGPEDIGKYLEDALEEEDSQVSDGLDGDIDQQAPEEQPSQESDEGYPVFENVFEAMEWAEKNGEVVRINYVTKKGTALVRDIEPHGRFHSESTKREILVCYDETVDGIRAFIATNVGNWAFVGRKFQKKFVVKA
jgi:predicted DNA-binding transcriptional regulator YafY